MINTQQLLSRHSPDFCKIYLMTSCLYINCEQIISWLTGVARPESDFPHTQALEKNSLDSSVCACAN